MMLAIAKWLGATAAVVALLGWIYHAGGESARQECNAAALAQELALAKKDLQEVEQKRVEADQRALQMAGRAKSNEEKADAIARDLDEALNKPAPDPVPGPSPAPIIVHGKCPAPPPYVDRGMSDGDVGRLRSIKGRH